jgi:hypothetical protein
MSRLEQFSTVMADATATQAELGGVHARTPTYTLHPALLPTVVDKVRQ